MKNRILFLLLFVMFSGNAICQEISDRLSFGVRAGIGVGNFDYIDELNSENYKNHGLANFTGGFIAEYMLSKSIYVCSEFDLNKRGGGFKKINNSITVIPIGSNSSTQHEYDYKNYIVNSIDIPLYLRVGYNEPEAVVFFNAGMVYSRIYSRYYSYNTWNLNNVVAEDEWHTETIDSTQNKNSFAFLVGIGVRKSFSKFASAIYLHPAISCL